MTEERIRLREEVQEQIRALKELKEMAATYGRGWGGSSKCAAERGTPPGSGRRVQPGAAGAPPTSQPLLPCPPAPAPPPPPPPPPPAGDDISRPATNAREAVQWLYYAYLGAVKEQVGWGPLHLAVQQP